MEPTIYCISGLGADERIFSKLIIKGYRLQHIPWLPPVVNESIEAYASRMAVPIQEENAILVGVSFGGMMAIEIAKQKTISKVIIISSVKSAAELPVWMRAAGKIRLNRMFSLVRPLSLIEGIANKRLGAFTQEEKEIARAYRKAANEAYVQWAVDQIVNWKNTWQPEGLLHIHGDADKIFPIQKIAQPVRIQGGTHFMVFNKADEISQKILDYLQLN